MKDAISSKILRVSQSIPSFNVECELKMIQDWDVNFLNNAEKEGNSDVAKSLYQQDIVDFSDNPKVRALSEFVEKGDGVMTVKNGKEKTDDEEHSIENEISSIKNSDLLYRNSTSPITDQAYLAKLPKYVLKHKFKGEKVIFYL